MIKSYTNRFYPNPFRYRKLKTLKEESEIVYEIQQNFKPFLINRFSEIQNYIDEFGRLKSEIKIIRIIREKIKDKYNFIINNLSCFPISIFQNLEGDSIENYYKNLRYLELPLQPSVDKNGFEIQMLSEELMEEAIDEIDEGFSFIYEYCSKAFPESIELWEDYALLNPESFPFIAHDYNLEAAYEVFDKIFDELQKRSINLYSWVISGDLNTRLLKVIKPNALIKLNYIVVIFESLLALTLSILIIKFLAKNTKSISNFENKRIILLNIKEFAIEIKKDIFLKKVRINQKMKRVQIQIEKLAFQTKFKYQLLKFISNIPRV